MAGQWETGPPADERCESCGKPVAKGKPQFLGLSNGDFAWYCNLTCLIEGADEERSLYTDGVGPDPAPAADLVNDRTDEEGKMGVRIVCEHGYYIDGCRCPSKHSVSVEACPWGGQHEDRYTYQVQPERVLNPEVLAPAHQADGEP